MLLIDKPTAWDEIRTSESTHRQKLISLISVGGKTIGVLKVIVIRVLIFKAWWEKLKT